jgi:hypothetical protein
MSKNDITGDDIKTKVITDQFRKNFEAIFGKQIEPGYTGTAEQEQEKPSDSKQDDTGNVRNPV